ncbi:hypothetical protein IC582_021490 [Cucumis melo]
MRKYKLLSLKRTTNQVSGDSITLSVCSCKWYNDLLLRLLFILVKVVDLLSFCSSNAKRSGSRARNLLRMSRLMKSRILATSTPALLRSRQFWKLLLELSEKRMKRKRRNHFSSMISSI